MAEEPTTRAARTDERRRLIVEAAVGVFLEKGFHQTSIRDIAERAGISLGNVYNHFAGKTELIAAIATLEAEENAALLALLESGNGAETLSAFVREYLETCSQPANGILTAEILSESFRSPEIRAGFTANRSKLVTALEGALPPSGASGTDRRDVAEMILDLVEGAAIRRLLNGPDTVSADRIVKAALQLATAG